MSSQEGMLARSDLSIEGDAADVVNRYFPTVYEPTVFENYVHGKPHLHHFPALRYPTGSRKPSQETILIHISSSDIFVDNVHIELSLWDTAGQEEFDRLRSLSYDDTHAIMLCFSVDSKDSLENVESKWVGEIAENCQGVKLVLVALKCDLRENGGDDDGEETAEGGVQREKKEMITYNQGLEVARRINALRYLECSAMRNRGVNEAFTESARVALSVKPNGGKDDGKCAVM